jgi:hypothetical protein
MMLGRNLGELSVAGWLLTVASLACMVLVSMPIGKWVLDTLDRPTFLSWLFVVICALALPGLGAAVLAFMCGERLLERFGIRVRRSKPE